MFMDALDADTALAVRRVLLRLAHDQEQAAADEAAANPYWKPCPVSVLGSRAAADALRSAADSVSPQLSIQ
jgi:hypothetical protein